MYISFHNNIDNITRNNIYLNSTCVLAICIVSDTITRKKYKDPLNFTVTSAPADPEAIFGTVPVGCARVLSPVRPIRSNSF